MTFDIAYFEARVAAQHMTNNELENELSTLDSALRKFEQRREVQPYRLLSSYVACLEEQESRVLVAA